MIFNYFFNKTVIFIGNGTKYMRKIIRISENDVRDIVSHVVKRIIKEDYCRHCAEDYMCDYDESYVFNEFKSNPKGKQNWLPLINKNMYRKAIEEFTKYGRFIKFPTKYIYQWMGIIMKNTSILFANTNISGHSNSFPVDEFTDFIESWYGDDRYIEINEIFDVKIQLSPQEVMKMCCGDKIDEAIDRSGQIYFPFVSQGEVDKHYEGMERDRNIEMFKSEYANLFNDIEKYNSKSGENNITVDYEKQMFIWQTNVFSVLDSTGIYEWMVMPDNSDAFSDYGLSPLYKIINEYSSDLDPEEVFVLINRALDVSHRRGDLSSIFIEGGSETLSEISG